MTADFHPCGRKSLKHRLCVDRIVFYYGDKPWDGAKSLHELTCPDENILPYINDYKINLYDYHDYESYDEFKGEVGLLFQALAAKRDKAKLQSIFTGEHEDISADGMRLIGKMIRIREVEMYKFENYIENNEVGHMCKALEDLKLEGRMLERDEIIQNALRSGRLSPSEISLILGVSIEDVAKVQQEMLETV